MCFRFVKAWPSSGCSAEVRLFGVALVRTDRQLAGILTKVLAPALHQQAAHMIYNLNATDFKCFDAGVRRSAAAALVSDG